MHRLLHAAASATALTFAMSAVPARAVVYVVTLSGEASENYLESGDGSGATVRQDFAPGGAFTAVFRFDTDRLPANGAQPGEDFRFEDGSIFFTSAVTFTGGGIPAFGGAATRNSVVGAFGAAGFVDLNDDRTLQDDAAAYEVATLAVSGFDGLQPIAGTSFPDFGTAGSLSFTLAASRLDQATGATRYGYAFGTISSAVVTPGAGGAVPEPATWATMAIGFGLLGGTLRRRRVAARI